MNELHRLSDVGADGIRGICALAERLRARPEPRALEGRVLGLLFLSPSLRTQASFQAAMARLGGGSFVISPDRNIHPLEFGGGAMDGATAEHIEEAVPVLASYADALGARSFARLDDLAADLADQRFETIRGLCPVPFINMESATRHPCQSIADWLTLDRLEVPERGGRITLSWARHPKPLPLAVACDTIRMATLRGMDLTVLRPDGFELPAEVMDEARAQASASGGSVRETADRDEAMDGAHVLYAKSWSSTRCYGDPSGDRRLRSQATGFTVDEDWFAGARDDCRFMHCLPARREVVVAARVLRSARSAVVAQAENRMWSQMAVLHRMLA